MQSKDLINKHHLRGEHIVSAPRPALASNKFEVSSGLRLADEFLFLLSAFSGGKRRNN
jgi:hypothetical protein